MNTFSKMILLLLTVVMVSCASKKDYRYAYYTQDYYTGQCEQKHHFARIPVGRFEIPKFVAAYTREYNANVIAGMRGDDYSFYRVLDCNYIQLKMMSERLVRIKIYFDEDN